MLERKGEREREEIRLQRLLHCVGHCVYVLRIRHVRSTHSLFHSFGSWVAHQSATRKLTRLLYLPLSLVPCPPLQLPLPPPSAQCSCSLSLLSPRLKSHSSSAAKGHSSYQCYGMCKWQVPRPITSSIRPPERCPKAIQSMFFSAPLFIFAVNKFETLC